MKCKYCKSIIENGSLYCRFCGAQLFTAQKKELIVPKPHQLADGRWTGQIMVAGERHSIYGVTQEEYEARARAMKAQLIAMKNQPPRLTLGTAIDKYIASVSNVLSPSTVRGYSYMRETRFKEAMPQLLKEIDWQGMINTEAEKCSPKTVKNAWGLISASLTALGEPVPDIHLPKVKRNELPFLNYKEIQVFLEAVKGDPVEAASILALHSLRRSELAALTAEDISDNFISVSKAIVMDNRNVLIEKDTTKTELSTRVIPVMIPRLLELIPGSGKIVTIPVTSLRDRINRICYKHGLPLVGCHGLRRSFASLGYHLKWSERSVMAIGGWSNIQTVHNLYIKLSQYDLNDDVKTMQDYYGFTR